jgi:hypothetical protein
MSSTPQVEIPHLNTSVDCLMLYSVVKGTFPTKVFTAEPSGILVFGTVLAICVVITEDKDVNLGINQNPFRNYSPIMSGNLSPLILARIIFSPISKV